MLGMVSNYWQEAGKHAEGPPGHVTGPQVFEITACKGGTEGPE